MDHLPPSTLEQFRLASRQFGSVGAQSLFRSITLTTCSDERSAIRLNNIVDSPYWSKQVQYIKSRPETRRRFSFDYDAVSQLRNQVENLKRLPKIQTVRFINVQEGKNVVDALLLGRTKPVTFLFGNVQFRICYRANDVLEFHATSCLLYDIITSLEETEMSDDNFLGDIISYFTRHIYSITFCDMTLPTTILKALLQRADRLRTLDLTNITLSQCDKVSMEEIFECLRNYTTRATGYSLQVNLVNIEPQGLGGDINALFVSL